jgi:hypothetical protein
MALFRSSGRRAGQASQGRLTHCATWARSMSTHWRSTLNFVPANGCFRRCADAVAEAAIGFGDRASPFFDVDNSGSPSNRPPATNFSATACAMPNSEKMRSRKPGSSSNPRWTRCRRRIAVSTRWSDGGLEAVCRCREDLTSTTTAPTIGRSSQDFRSDAIRTKSSLINGGGQNSCPRSNVFEALGEI